MRKLALFGIVFLVIPLIASPVMAATGRDSQTGKEIQIPEKDAVKALEDGELDGVEHEDHWSQRTGIIVLDEDGNGWLIPMETLKKAELGNAIAKDAKLTKKAMKAPGGNGTPLTMADVYRSRAMKAPGGVLRLSIFESGGWMKVMKKGDRVALVGFGHFSVTKESALEHGEKVGFVGFGAFGTRESKNLEEFYRTRDGRRKHWYTLRLKESSDDVVKFKAGSDLSKTI